MLVCNQDGGDFLGPLIITITISERTQPLESFAAGQTGIHQNARCTSRHQCTVPTTAAGEHRYRHSHRRSLPRAAVETATVFQQAGTFDGTGWFAIPYGIG